MHDALRIFVTGLGDAATSPTVGISAAFTVVALFIYHWAVVRSRLRKATGARRPDRPAGTGSADVAELEARVAALEGAAPQALQHVGFVRFNAFPDVGSDLSFALAVVDGDGNGFLVTSIYSREEVRTYAKAVRGFAADKEISGEELRALDLAREHARTRSIS
jgi:hypothetical protein